MPRYEITLGMPGPLFSWGAITGISTASSKHNVQTMNAGNGWDTFNTLWTGALNAREKGQITHFAMLHADVAPCANWIDILVDELEDRKASFISVAIPIKDNRGVLSCGIGNPEGNWGPLRRFTVRELQSMPKTFDAADVGYAGYPLLHNNGCWIADLREQEFFRTDEEGGLRCLFDFRKQIVRDQKTSSWRVRGESEDWYFSRQMFEMGIPSIITRKVAVAHQDGSVKWTNDVAWGTFDHDENTRHLWDRPDMPTLRNETMEMATV